MHLTAAVIALAGTAHVAAMALARAADAPSVASTIRIEPDLVVVSAVNDAVLHKDYEAVVSIRTVDSAGIRMHSDWAMPDPQAPDGVRRQQAESLERMEDTQKSHRLIIWYLPGDPETMPGSTGPTPSAQLFDEISRTGEAPIVVGAVSRNDGGSLGGALSGLFAGRKYFRGTVKRLGVEPIRVLVNGAPTMLSAMHVAGTVSVGSDRGDVEFWWLDDPAVRIALKFSFQGSVVQVVRINVPTRVPDTLDKALAGKSCRSEVPGIFFLSDSAQLLPASAPAIARIAATLQAHGDWVVTVEGHTDSTGSDEHNMDLSKRRAEALKAELVTRHGIPAARLQTAGYGRTRPIDSNDTLDGRAHNRRVEIARRC